MDNEDALWIGPLVFTVSTSAYCWKCGMEQDVVGIGTSMLRAESGEIPEDAGVFMLVYIEDVPTQLLEEIMKSHPRFGRRSSKGSGSSYYANSCECGEFFGDHFLFSEPGGPFWPQTPAAESALSFRDIDLGEPARITASWSQGVISSIYSRSKKQ